MAAETYRSGCLLACLWDFRDTLLERDFILFMYLFYKA